MSDWDLLQEFVRTRSDSSFRKLIERHQAFVYRVCLRETDNHTLAEDSAIAVFLLLSQKAQTIRRGVLLTSWLFKVARLTSRNAIQKERRRVAKEHEAYEMNQLQSESKQNDIKLVDSYLNDALGALPDRERDAILLRYQDGMDVRDVGKALGISESAAKMRLSRGLEKMRQVFASKGTVASESSIITVLLAADAKPLPASFLTKISSISPLPYSATPPLALLYKGVYFTMQATKYKYMIAGVVFLVLGIIAVPVVIHMRQNTFDNGGTGFQIVDQTGYSGAPDPDRKEISADIANGCSNEMQGQWKDETWDQPNRTIIEGDGSSHTTNPGYYSFWNGSSHPDSPDSYALHKFGGIHLTSFQVTGDKAVASYKVESQITIQHQEAGMNNNAPAGTVLHAEFPEQSQWQKINGKWMDVGPDTIPFKTSGQH